MGDVGVPSLVIQILTLPMIMTYPLSEKLMVGDGIIELVFFQDGQTFLERRHFGLELLQNSSVSTIILKKTAKFENVG